MTLPLTPVSSLAAAACARVRRRLDSYLAGELTVETNHEILEHLEHCPDCRLELEAREKLRAAVKRSGASAAGPNPEFETRVKALVGATPPPRHLPVSGLVLVAASAAALVGLTLLVKPSLLRGPSASPSGTVASSSTGTPNAAAVDLASFDLAARNHLDCALKGSWPETPPPPETVAAALDPSLAPVFRSLAPRLAGYSAVAAHLCSHGGREFFHVIFRKDGTSGPEGLVSLAASRRAGGALPPARVLFEAHAEAAGRAVVVPIRGSHRSGLDIAGVEAGDWLVFVVSSRGEAENGALARAILPAALTAFAG